MILKKSNITETLLHKQDTLRIINFGCDVKTYIEIIFTIRIEVYCNVCNSLMVYHGCYQVNYKSNELITKIVILRVRCKKCNVTHSLKPEFLASRHQYDTLERQRYVLQYNDISKRRFSLRNLCNKLFPSVMVSHTVMYYWVRVAAVKKNIVEPLITGEIQNYLPSCDICSELLPEANELPAGIREKEYSKDFFKLLNWGRIYIRVTAVLRNIQINEYNLYPYIYTNRILDILTAHTFL
jgi:hypothetical protein